jgi:hypothetical protein
MLIDPSDAVFIAFFSGLCVGIVVGIMMALWD